MGTARTGQEQIRFQASLYRSKNPTRRWLHCARRDWILSAIEALPKPTRPAFFEAGVGCCLYTRWLAERGEVVDVIDINPAFVDAAYEIDGVVARVGDITFEGGGELHDVALCSEVLEHVDDSRAALRHLYQSLKPGGALVLTTPNAYSTAEAVGRLLSFRPVARFARLVYGEPVAGLGHINLMTRSQLREQILQAGFRIVRQDNTGLYLPLVAEFGGHLGLRLCRWLAQKLEGTHFSWLLWTQCWVLRRPE
jgi:SAM-dependent methyltransferase